MTKTAILMVAWVALVACGESDGRETPEPGDEKRYLAFQLFVGTQHTWQPWVDEVAYTPKSEVAAAVQGLIDAIDARGNEKTRLAFVVGPLAFDLSDAETVQTIDDAFDIAVEKNIAVGFHIDESMFWKRRPQLGANPGNLEKTGWNGPVSSGLAINWAEPPARLCINAPAIQNEAARRARTVIGPKIASRVAALDNPDLFAGVIAGWETHMGRDRADDQRLGYCALANRGFGADNPPESFADEIAKAVNVFINLWTAGLTESGLDPRRVYSHVALLSSASFEILKTTTPGFPLDLTYGDMVDAWPSTQRPAVAFGPNHRPGFTTYPDVGVFEQIYEELDAHEQVGWASSEGTNILLGEDSASGISMSEYLARAFDHGATLVNLFGWGIGEPGATNPFREVTEGDEAIVAYRSMLVE